MVEEAAAVQRASGVGHAQKSGKGGSGSPRAFYRDVDKGNMHVDAGGIGGVVGGAADWAYGVTVFRKAECSRGNKLIRMHASTAWRVIVHRDVVVPVASIAAHANTTLLLSTSNPPLI